MIARPGPQLNGNPGHLSISRNPENVHQRFQTNNKLHHLHRRLQPPFLIISISSPNSPGRSGPDPLLSFQSTRQHPRAPTPSSCSLITHTARNTLPQAPAAHATLEQEPVPRQHCRWQHPREMGGEQPRYFFGLRIWKGRVSPVKYLCVDWVQQQPRQRMEGACLASHSRSCFVLAEEKASRRWSFLHRIPRLLSSLPICCYQLSSSR